MKFAILTVFVGLSLTSVTKSLAQPPPPPTVGNRDFEQSTIVSSSPSGYGFNSGTATVPDWTEYDGWGDSNYSGGATLIYNSQPLDEAGVSLIDTNYWTPSLQGQFSILLEGGSGLQGPTSAAIGQTVALSPLIESVIYWGAANNNMQITFDGNPLAFQTLQTTASHTVYGADISAYAGDTGQLLFTASSPYGGGVIDNLQFSTSPVPEPGRLGLYGVALVLLMLRKRWHQCRC